MKPSPAARGISARAALARPPSAISTRRRAARRAHPVLPQVAPRRVTAAGSLKGAVTDTALVLGMALAVPVAVVAKFKPYGMTVKLGELADPATLFFTVQQGYSTIFEHLHQIAFVALGAVAAIMALSLLLAALPQLKPGKTRFSDGLISGKKIRLASDEPTPKAKAAREKLIGKRYDIYQSKKGVKYDFTKTEADPDMIVSYDQPEDATRVKLVLPRVSLMNPKVPFPEDQRYTFDYGFKDTLARINLIFGRVAILPRLVYGLLGLAVMLINPLTWLVFVKSALGLVRALLGTVGGVFGSSIGGALGKTDFEAGLYTSLERYDSIFNNFLKSAPSEAYWHHDGWFAAQRLCGNNPVLIKRCSSTADVPRAVLEALKRERVVEAMAPLGVQPLEALAKRGSLYMVDYAQILAAVEGEDVDVGHLTQADLDKRERHLPRPCALFYWSHWDDAPKLMPLAIAVGHSGQGGSARAPGADSVDVYWPLMQGGTAEGPHPAWTAAKTYCQAADGTIHELRTHLGRTHLAMEPVAGAFSRALAPSHPIAQLMRAHTQLMMRKNADAAGKLAQPAGFVNFLVGPPTMCQAYDLVDDAVASWSVKQYALFQELRNRGFKCEITWYEDGGTFQVSIPDDDPLPSPLYGYRDDGVLYWNAIDRYVTTVVNGVYPSDDDMRADPELMSVFGDANFNGRGDGRPTVFWDGPRGDYDPDYRKEPGPKWTAEVTDGVPFPAAADLTREDVILALDTFIYTSSAHHSVVNYGQEHFKFTPGAPLSVSRGDAWLRDLKASYPRAADAPTEGPEGHTVPPGMRSILPVLPSATGARLVVTIITALTSFRYDRLGYTHYPFFGPMPDTLGFVPPPIKGLLSFLGTACTRKLSAVWRGHTPLAAAADGLVEDLYRGRDGGGGGVSIKDAVAANNEARAAQTPREDEPKYTKHTYLEPGKVLNSISI